MHYDPNYRNQFFYDSSNSIGIKEAIGIAKRELAVSEIKTKMPKSKLSKVTLYGFLGVIALILLATALVWFITKSLLFTIVLFVIMAFFSVAVSQCRKWSNADHAEQAQQEYLFSFCHLRKSVLMSYASQRYAINLKPPSISLKS